MTLVTSEPKRRGVFQDYCPAERRRYVLIAAILASAMGFIDGTIVSIAIPAIRSSLDASLADAQWINNAYMLALSALVLFGGATGDRYGLRLVFSAGIGIFVIASLACAIAPNAESLIAARAAQGIAAAFMIPGSLAIISKTYPRRDRARAIGIWAAASAITTAAGPILGGAVLSFGGSEAWRILFAINLPVGAIALGLMLTRVPPDAPVGRQRLDVAGAVLVSLGLGLVAWALTGSGGEGSVPGLSHILGYGIAGALALGGFLYWQARSAYPMMPLRLFASSAFSAANVVTFTLYFALAGILFFLPMTLIAGWRLSEAQVGIMFVPMTAAIAALSGPVGSLAARTGPGPLIGAGSAIVAVAYGLLAAGMGWMTFWGHVLPSLSLMGLGMALVVAPLSAAVMGAVDDGDQGVASGINNAVSRMAALVAVAGLGGVAALVHGMAGGVFPFGAEVPLVAAQAHLDGMNAGFSVLAWIAAALSAVSAVVAFRYLPAGPTDPQDSR